MGEFTDWWKGDQTPAQPEEVTSNSEFRGQRRLTLQPEVDVAPKIDLHIRGLLLGTSTHKNSLNNAIRDFFEGLNETSRARARLTEAELSTNQTKIALLKSKNKIGEKERELLNHDLENLERALGNVLERRETVERRLHESRVWNKMFYLDMVRIGAVLKPPSDDEDTERPRKKSKNSTSDGTEGPSEPREPPITTSRYVVPTGRVKVLAGRYVVPTGKNNVIVSTGRTKVIPAGRTILVV
ncbi:hypothetical protein Tco_0722744, partial [Tanacetum coccineum]